MTQRGRAGQPVATARWWSSGDVDLATIMDARSVRVLEILHEVPPSAQAPRSSRSTGG